MFNNNNDLIAFSVWAARDDVDKEWRQARRKALDYYRGRVINYTKTYFDPRIWSKLPFSNNNVVKRLVDRTSLVFSEPAIRTIGPPRKDTDPPTTAESVYASVTKKKNTDLLQAERMTNLLNYTLLRISLTINGFRYKPVHEFMIDVTDDGHIIKVSYPLPTSSHVLGSALDEWEQWTADEVAVFNRGDTSQNVREVNHLGRVPFVIVKNSDIGYNPTEVDPANDLVSFNEAINVAEARLDSNILFQTTGTIVITGLNAIQSEGSEPIYTGPDNMLVLNDSPDATVQMLTPPNTIAAVGEDISRKARTIAGNYHVTSAFLEGNDMPTSGVSLRVRNEELRDSRKEATAIWREAEDRIYEIERAFLGVDWEGLPHERVTLPEEFNVDFGEKAIILTQSEAEAQNAADLAINLITPAQILQRRDPDKFDTLSKYQDFIDNNKIVNDASKSASENNDGEG